MAMRRFMAPVHRRSVSRVTSIPQRGQCYASRAFSSRFYSSSSRFSSSYSYAWLAASTVAGCTFFLVGRQVYADEGEDDEKSIFTKTYEMVFGESFDEPDFLAPPVSADQYGRIPRTLVVNFSQTICYPLWTREGGWLVRKRPCLDEFISTAFFSGFEMMIWSSGTSHMDEQNVADLDPQNLFRNRFYRDQQSFKGMGMVKDLNLLGRKLERVVVVDHDPSCVYPPENVIRVSPFKDDIDDTELSRIADFLANVNRYNINDVRPYIKKFNEDPDGDHFQEERELVDKARIELVKVIKVDIDNQVGWLGWVKKLFITSGNTNSSKNVNSYKQ